MNADDLFVELSAATRLSREKWEEILQLPGDLQALVLANYADQDWTRPGSTLDDVLRILGIVGTVAGVAGGVAGAAGAIAALRAL